MGPNFSPPRSPPNISLHDPAAPEEKTEPEQETHTLYLFFNTLKADMIPAARATQPAKVSRRRSEQPRVPGWGGKQRDERGGSAQDGDSFGRCEKREEALLFTFTFNAAACLLN